MNRLLSLSELKAIETDLQELFARADRKQEKHSAPFSKRQAGRDRRKERRQTIARKAAWIQE